MNYKQSAKELAQQGRYGDTMLMHVSPKEVAGLNYLSGKYGTQITRNPKTGLPEAFNVNRFLPVIAGAALAPYTGGMSAGLIVGGVETARTGSLLKGAQAGFGAFSGANMATSLGTMGAEQAVAEQTAANLGATGVETAAAAAPTGGDILAAQQPGNLEAFLNQQSGATFTPDATMLPGGEVQTVALTPEQIAGNEAYIKAGQDYAQAATQAQASAPPGFGTPDFKPTYSDMARGFERLGTTEGLQAMGSGILEDPMAAAKTAGSLYAASIEEPEPYVKPPRDPNRYPEAEPYRREYRRNPNPSLDREFVYYANRGGITSLRSGGPTRFNVGGLSEGYADYMRQLQQMLNKRGMSDAALPGQAGTPTQMMTASTKPQEMTKMKAYKAGGSVPILENGGFVLRASTVNGVGNGSSEAGMKYLQAKLGAVPIRGKGDGTKDQIATSIEGRRKALLSNEEAYVPRSVVAQLGNGDVNKGAKKLDEFMKKVDKARTGKAKPPKTINPDKLTPKKTTYA
jgi:hypothetical protein